MSEVVFSPVELNQPGFYAIPGFSKNGVNHQGIVINRETEEVVEPHRSNDYRYVWIYSDRHKCLRSVALHRIVALAFLGPPPYPKALVNHKDGIRSNNNSDNIEWTDHSGNIDHAYRTGLRTDNRPVMVKDLRDGRISRFHSLQACAKHFGVAGERIWRNIRDNTGNIYFNFYVFRYEDDERPWPELTAQDIGKTNSGQPKAVVAYDLSSGRRTIAHSAMELGRVIGVGGSTITYALRTGRQYPVKGYLFKWLHDETPWNPDYTTGSRSESAM